MDLYCCRITDILCNIIQIAKEVLTFKDFRFYSSPSFLIIFGILLQQYNHPANICVCKIPSCQINHILIGFIPNRFFIFVRFVYVRLYLVTLIEAVSSSTTRHVSNPPFCFALLQRKASVALKDLLIEECVKLCCKEYKAVGKYFNITA